MRTQPSLRLGATDTMHKVANMVSSCRSWPSSWLRVKSISSAQASQHQRAPRHSQANAERGLGRAAPADIADQGVHPAVRHFDHIVEITAKQHVLTAGQAARRDAQARVAKQRRR